MKKKHKQVSEKVIVPSTHEMNDPTFIKHFNKRHRESDTPFFRIDMPYHAGMECGYMRAFHAHCHEAEANGGTVNDVRPNYDHIHEEEDDV